MQRFESILLAPAIILGPPAEAGLNQKNSTSLTLGTQTAFDFYPPKIFGGLKRDAAQSLHNRSDLFSVFRWNH